MASLKCLASFCLLFNVIITVSFPSATADCNPSGNIVCNGQSYPRYACSPPVSSYTRGKLTLNDFRQGGEGGDRSECDDQFHDNNEFVVALSTGWCAGGSRCGRTVVISTLNGGSVGARVVDECDSVRGCDAEHGGLPPCGNNIVDASAAVWDALGLDHSLGIVDILWIMAA